jgi:hypothetical protein
MKNMRNSGCNGYVEGSVHALFGLALVGLLIGLLVFVNKTSTYNKTDGIKIPKSPIETKMVVIDGCEYLMYRSYYGCAEITHKGNCLNPIHMYNIER